MEEENKIKNEEPKEPKNNEESKNNEEQKNNEEPKKDEEQKIIEQPKKEEEVNKNEEIKMDENIIKDEEVKNNEEPKTNEEQKEEPKNNEEANTIYSNIIPQGNAVPDFSRLKPWNSREYPVKVNSIRYNNDYSLLTLGTSKGYKIFLTSNLLPVNEITEEVTNLGDISVAMVYYKSSLVFLLPSRYNTTYTNKELIIFDDFYQKKIASFKDKFEEFLNFFVSKNIALLITLSKVVVLELYTFKIVDIIDNINTMNKFLSYNFFDFIAYVKLKDKKSVHIKYYQNEKHKISSIIKKKIESNFEFMQVLALNASGKFICIVSIFGNKIHIYNTQEEKLKFCIYLGPSIQVIENIFFSQKKSNYLFLLKNENKFSIYKLPIDSEFIKGCVCDKYDDSKITTETKKEGLDSIIDFFKKLIKNKDIWESHANGELNGEIEFVDFDRNKNKDIIYINKKGEFFHYHFNKMRTGNLLPKIKVQWV